MRSGLLFHLLIYCSVVLGQVPRPDHVLITIFENRAYEYLKGNVTKAPFINSLLTDSNVALFTQSYGLHNPSQVNYLMLYSGSGQGIVSDSIPDGLPFNTCNLGANLLSKGFTISSYCESMPSVGYTGPHYGKYLMRHNPVAYWQGTGTNNTPPEINRPYSDFPSDYKTLPDVSIVIGNVDHDMHNGTTEAGDQWFESQLKPYLDWARQNNSLLIFTFDEDDLKHNNHILTFFYGPMVKGGEYNARIDHYNVLRTVEDMFALPHCANAATADPIDYVWKNVATAVSNSANDIEVELFPVPAGDQLSIYITTGNGNSQVAVTVVDLIGERVLETSFQSASGRNTISLDTQNLTTGIYFLHVITDTGKVIRKFAID